MLGERVAQRVDGVDGDVSEHDVLVTAEMERAVAVPFGEIGDGFELATAQVTHGHVDGDQRPADGALGSYAGAPSTGRRGRENRRVLDVPERGDGCRMRMRPPASVFECGRPLGAEPLFPEAFHHELQAALGGMIEIAVHHEDVDKRFGRRQHVTAGHELVQPHREVGRTTQAAAAPHLVTGLPITDHGDEPAVVQ